MSIDRLVDDVLRGVLGGRRKRARGAMRFLTRDVTRGVTRGMFRNPTTLLGIAGVAWGIYETMQNHGTSPAAAPSPQPAAGPPPPLPIDEERLRLVRLAVSAAHADGAMNEKERAAVVQQVTEAGAAHLLERELAAPLPLRDVVAGITYTEDRATLYVLAYTILRADEQITGAERIYLAQLANLLGLEPSLVQALEKDTGERIDALGDQGQLGG
ncbi:MAG: DUF533 domain-containing protein [Vicinamibacterales bacterium]